MRISFETALSQRTSSGKRGFLQPKAPRNQKQPLTPHVPSSHSAAPSPAAQSQSEQADMHTCRAVSVILHSHATLTSRSSVAAVPRQAGKAPSLPACPVFPAPSSPSSPAASAPCLSLLAIRWSPHALQRHAQYSNLLR